MNVLINIPVILPPGDNRVPSITAVQIISAISDGKLPTNATPHASRPIINPSDAAKSPATINPMDKIIHVVNHNRTAIDVLIYCILESTLNFKVEVQKNYLPH